MTGGSSDRIYGDGVAQPPAWRSVRLIVLKALLVVASLALLSSVGGAGAVAAPFLLVLQWLAARSSRVLAEAPLWGFLAVATTAEAIWALTYLGLGERQPWIWLIPVAVGLAGGVVAFRVAWKSARSRQPTV